MIPTLLVLGLVAGVAPRGWLVIGVAALAWPLLLWGSGVESGVSFVVGAAALAAANTAIGVALGSLVRIGIAGLRAR